MKSLSISTEIKYALINMTKIVKLLIKLLFKKCKLRLFFVY